MTHPSPERWHWGRTDCECWMPSVSSKELHLAVGCRCIAPSSTNLTKTLETPTQEGKRNTAIIPTGYGGISIQSKPGALVLLPENRDGTELMVATQVRMEARTQGQWTKICRDKDWMISTFQKDYNDWGGTARKIIDSIARNSQAMYSWPFTCVSGLKKWVSDNGRVLVLGDTLTRSPRTLAKASTRDLTTCTL